MGSALGICIGASTIKAVAVDENYNILRKIIKNHESNPKKELKTVLKQINAEDYKYIAITGRKFKDLLNITAITEPEASEYALKKYLANKNDKFNALISLGSENFILYVLDEKGNIIKVQTGNKCASGTGEFFLQQIRRMSVKPDKAIELAKKSEPYSVSGRCSVFCKSDCTHALNKGIPIGRVCAGLGDMMAGKVIELLQHLKKENVIIVGGVTENSYVIKRLREKIKGLVIPENANVFEAMGAAVYALENKKEVKEEISVKEKENSFSNLPSLAGAKHLVEFKEHERGTARQGDECILGLDVGSTTTKAVLLRTKDNKILCSIYLRTNGDPVKASRECYKDIDKQLKNIRVKIIGLGVTGSGRKIAGLHAMTDGIINEIIAHATAATFFDKEVDTIIEIGGQDAKYTYLVNGVPCDYAMNEACSAGTGSFLEEASKESLNITYLDIQDIALKADNPPNFNDQCAAFISSDVKNASHENISRENIVAGLVYSICMNYNNRVKGARRLGDKIFMQGGVCYNKAVPLAMASILKKQIIVPPDPGLMGAFGVALEIKNRIKTKLADKSEFSLKELVEREVEYDKSFTCPGTQENCDRGCTINMIKIGDKKYPFGGICNKYYNLMHHISIDSTPLNLVAKREKLLFEKKETAIKGKIIGIPKTFYVNMLYPLYYNFFDRLGLNVVLGDKVDLEGVKKVSTSFCFPAEIAHGMFMDLLKKNPSYIFLPQVTELFIKNTKTRAREHQCTCLLAQSEPFFIRSSFRDIDTKIFSPVIDFRKGWNTMENEFVKLGAELGKGKNETKKAFRYGVKKLEEFDRRKKEFGDKMLEELKKDKTKIAIVIFGRGYNAFVDEANLGIPSKLASRGVYVIPFDCLRYESEEHIEKMNWALGHDILKASKLVKEHPQLFGAYITNFSCGPDSFLVGYFRDIMATKPSLTLELDSHSADAGINTRIEAFLDIVNRFRQLSVKDEENDTFRAAEIKKINGKYKYLTSDRKQHSLKDIKMLIPSMGRTISEFSAATMRGAGYKSGAVELPEFETLMLGRKNTSCKECLPLILTTASLLDYIQKNPDEKLIYFMPTCPGNCRFSQYNVFINKLIKKKQLKNIALLSLTSENSYIGLGIGTQLNVLRALIVADIMDDIRNAMLVLPEDKEAALKIYDEQKDKLNKCFENGSKDIYEVLEEVASELSKIKLKTPLSKAKKALVAGEIYVRKDEFSSQEVIKRLAKKGIVSMRSPMLEWIYYVDYLTKTMYAQSTNLKEKTGLFFKEIIEKRFEKKIKKILAKSGLYEYEIIDVEKTMATGSNFVNPAFTSEVILVIGAFFNEVAHKVHGVISIGPFGCMPTRVTESILNHECIIKGNKRLGFLSDDVKKFHTLPFLSIECDGNPFPQIVESRIEAFSLQVERVYDHLNR